MANTASAAELTTITLSVPGPGAVSYLPIDLIPLIGADKAEGVTLKIVHVAGGGVAMDNLMNGSSDFAAVGLPAFMSARTKDKKVVGIAALNDLPLLVLVVRNDLKNVIRTAADLKGRPLGVTTSSLTSKTAGQQLAELIILNSGLKLEDVKWVAAGQSLDENMKLLNDKTIDAVMTDATFATEMVMNGKAYTLINLGDPFSASKIPGGRYLHGALGTREDLIQKQPQVAEKMVRMVQSSLAWIRSHKNEELLNKFEIKNPNEKKALLVTMMIYRRMFSTDGKFSAEQMKETEVFFRKANPSNAAAQTLELKTMIDSRWAGTKP